MQIKLIILLILIVSVNINGQKWNIINKHEITDKGIKDIIPDKFTLYTLDDEVMKSLLWSAPSESGTEVNRSNTFINIGLPDEVQEIFRIVRYDMMEPELAAKFPDIRTFYGIAVSNPLKSVRIDYTIQGFRAVVNSPEDGKIFIDHYQRNDKNTRIVYYKNDYINAPSWGCGVTDEHINRERPTSGGTRIGDCQLRSYRLAQATTGEYSTFHGGTTTSVMSAVVNVINRINQVYEAEVAVRLILVANTNLIFYYNAATDPYTNTSGDLNANQTTCTNVIGSANYDIGHLFGTGGGGVAQLGSVCSSSGKARGLTGSGNPVGDPFTIDYVAHEMGHQFAGNHTFAGTSGSCSGNRSLSNAMEPGSGSSIMAYAGICTGINVQNNSDATFHARSLQEIKNFVAGTGNSCSTIVGSFVNSAPTVTSQSNYSIPISTPFVLTLNATDPNGNPITYMWDQMDVPSSNGSITTAPASTNTSGPMFRNYIPTTSSSRYFPPIANVIANTTNTWNVLPSVARAMNFRGVARDFTGVAGCNSEINVTVSTVNTSAGAFSITSQNTATTWEQGLSYTVTWNVAGSTQSPVNAANVDIFLSYDGGNTFPVTLLAATPNDGTQSITVPVGITTQGRIMVRGTNHIFFDINNANITITAPAGGTYDINANPITVSGCAGSTLNTIIGATASGGFSSPVTLSVSGLPLGANGSFNSNPINPGSNTTLSITGINTPGIYNIVINGVSGSQNKTVNVTLNVGNVTIPTLISPANGATVVSVNPVLSWNPGVNAISYEVQVAYDESFQKLAIATTTNNTNYQPVTPLYGGTTFYWKTRNTNNCGLSPWSVSRSFTTESCWFYAALDVPLNISVSGGQSVFSNLIIKDRGIITDLNISSLIGTKDPVSELKFSMINPINISDLFWNMPCPGKSANFDIKFDDEATSSNWPCPPTDGLTYIPSNPLSVLDGYQMKGLWKLGIQNQGTSPDGILQSWQVKNCVSNFCRLTVDHTRSTGPGSLAEAINCSVDGDTIRFAATIQNDTFMVGNQTLTINKNIFIESDIVKNIHIMSTSASPTIVNTTPGNGNGLKIKGLHIHSSNAGIGAIQNSGKLTLDGVIMHKWPGSSTATIMNQTGGNTILSGNCKVITD